MANSATVAASMNNNGPGGTPPARNIGKISVELVIATAALAAGFAALNRSQFGVAAVMLLAGLLLIAAVQYWSRSRSSSIACATLAVLLTLFAVFFLVAPASSSINPPASEQPQLGQSAPSSPTPALPAAADPPRGTPSSPSDSPTPPTPLSPPAPRRVYLTELPVVGTDTRNTVGLYTTGRAPFKVNGKTYPHGILFNAGCSSSDGGDYWVEYDLGRSYSRLTTMVGLSDEDSSDAAVSYSVSLDNVEVAQGNLRLGVDNSIDVPVKGALRLRLKINDPIGPTRRVCTLGDNPWKAYVIWGDPTLTP